MNYIVAIPTTRERGYEVIRCLQSIKRDKTYKDYNILVFGQTDDTTIENNLRNLSGLPSVFYLGPESMQRLVIYLENRLGLRREDLTSLFNYKTFGGVRNLLTAFPYLLVEDLQL